MSKKILIANRGEIALRALRACKELDLKTVAIYSSGDKELKHLRLADETVCVGPASPLESYLNIPSILSAAELTRSDAIYPGYGFLAEDADFAARCEASGCIFIGASSDVIRQMGDKITAKGLAEESNIPIVPGYKGKIPETDEAIKKIAAGVGYPLIIKASAGGGGRGMRVVHEESELIASLQLTKQEAKNAFGNDTIYFEKFIQNPRHIEVQIGVGFRANLKGEILNLQIGFSHDVNFKIPKEIKITVEKQTIIKINGVDKELVSKVAADIKNLKPVEPYKAKGIKEKGQFILRKEGKKK